MYEFYRSTIVGRALLDVIDEKVKNNILTPEQAMLIAQKYDEIIPKVFKRITNTTGFKGNLLTYNFVDGVWKFLCSDVTLNVNNSYSTVPFLKIVACDADTTEQAGRKRKKK